MGGTVGRAGSFMVEVCKKSKLRIDKHSYICFLSTIACGLRAARFCPDVPQRWTVTCNYKAFQLPLSCFGQTFLSRPRNGTRAAGMSGIGWGPTQVTGFVGGFCFQGNSSAKQGSLLHCVDASVLLLESYCLGLVSPKYH